MNALGVKAVSTRYRNHTLWRNEDLGKFVAAQEEKCTERYRKGKNKYRQEKCQEINLLKGQIEHEIL